MNNRYERNPPISDLNKDVLHFCDVVARVLRRLASEESRVESAP